jgi:superfamily II DNA helicase RecQ
MSNLDSALAALRTHFNFDDFRAGQSEVIDAVLAGHDTVVVMPTGGGKSLCYQLPALMKDGATIVVSPLIALMKDQVDALHARGLPATFINSSIDFEEQKARINGIDKDITNSSMSRPNAFAAPTSSRRSRASMSRSSPSMKPTASRPGDTIFAPISCALKRPSQRSGDRRSSRSRPPPRLTCAPTSSNN